VTQEPHGHQQPHNHQQPTSNGRPPDVDTGFWLWITALPLMMISYLEDVFFPPVRHPAVVTAMSAVFAFVLVVIVVTFLILLRQGYRWTRTLLTGGGIASVVYAAGNLFATERAPVPAVIYAVATIVGAVLILGGVYLLHRKDAHAYFTR
jgi:hypothetical protein